MIKKYNQYIKENNIAYSSDEIDPYGEEDWDEVELTPVLIIAKKLGLPYSQITELNCSEKDLMNLDGIENLINLQTLDCDNNNLISLKGIENIVNLEILICRGNNLTSLEGLENLINIKYLDITRNNLTSLKGIENLINLEYLICRNNNFSNEYIKNIKEYCKNKKIFFNL